MPDSKPGPADESLPDKTVAKPDDDGELTFSEWRQRVLAEEDKEKHHGQYWNEVSRFEPPREKPTMWFPNRSDTNRTAQ